MLTIRFTRKGKKNQPFFRIVVIDKKRSSKGGRAVEELGFFDPLTKRKSLNKERFLHWIKNGAQPSATVHNLLVKEGIISGKKIHVARVKKSQPGAGQPSVEAPKPVVAQAVTVPVPVPVVEAPAPAPVAEQPAPVVETPAEVSAIEPEKPAEAPVSTPEPPAHNASGIVDAGGEKPVA